MRWYMDTEFAENGTTIKLISIALVSESGDEFYACASDGWSPDDCDEWVKENVLAKLPPRSDASRWMSRAQIREAVLDLLNPSSGPEIWAYFADYDWVAFCQLFGRMVDLPGGMPMFCRDIKQEMDRLGMSKKDLPALDPKVAHDALTDARWNREAHRVIRHAEMDG